MQKRGVRFYLYDNVDKKFVEIHDGFLCGRTEGDLKFANDTVVSRRQCVFHITGNDVYVEDLNSLNRTEVNSAAVQPGFKRRIQLGDVIEFGSQRLVLTHQDKFAPAVQDRSGQKRPYKAARTDGGGLTSDISQLLTKKTLIALDKATFRKLRLEETFSGRTRRRSDRDPQAARSAYGIVVLIFGAWVTLVVWLSSSGAFESGLPSEAGELVVSSLILAGTSGLLGFLVYSRLVLPSLRSARGRANGVVLVTALSLGLAAVLALKTGFLTRTAHNLAVIQCSRGWNPELCQKLVDWDQSGWVRLPPELRLSIDSRLRR